MAFGLSAALDAELKPIAEMEALIYERTGEQPGTVGGWFKLNLKVDDILESFSIHHRGVRLAPGHSTRAVPVVYVPKMHFKALVTHPLLRKNQTPILDMEAGVEHSGRGTAGSVDAFVIALQEPGLRSLGHGGADLRVGCGDRHSPACSRQNKTRHAEDEAFIRAHADGLPVLGSLPYTPDAVAADQGGLAVFDQAPELLTAAERIADALAELTVA